MLLVIAASACFAIWLRNHSIVYQRRVARQRARTVLLATDYVIVDGREQPRIPTWRTMLGDEAVICMWLKEDTSDEEAARTIALFPEAEVRCPPFWTKGAP